jgi:predicted nucleic acid-binding Zn finger protein
MKIERKSGVEVGDKKHTIWLPLSKQAKVISATVFCSCDAFSTDRRGAYVASGKWMRGKL